MYNTIVTVCHLVSDPELREISADKKVCKMRVCVSPSRAKTKCFLDVEAWDRTAEVCAEFLKKGREVLIQGELCMDTWEKDGAKQNKYFIRASAVQFIGGNKEDSGEGGKKGSTGGKGSGSSSSKATFQEDDDVPF